MILSDTVGFISDLPTELVAAFRATLEAVIEADALVHVRDIAHSETEQQRADVEAVLERLNEDADAPTPPLIEAWNKVDLLDAERRIGRSERAKRSGAIPISALTGEGVRALLEEIDRVVYGAKHVLDITLDPADGAKCEKALELPGPTKGIVLDPGSSRIFVSIASKNQVLVVDRVFERQAVHEVHVNERAGEGALGFVARLNHEINAGLTDAQVRTRLANVGGTVIPGTPADFRKVVTDETEKWGGVVRAANIKAE